MKSPDERGHPASVWIVEAREKLGLSDRQVVDMLGRYDPATLRQAEAHSSRLSKPMWRALVPLYQTEAIARGVALPPPPRYKEQGEAVPETAANLAALIASNEAVVRAVASQTEALERVWRSNDRQAKAIEDLASAIRDRPALTYDDAQEMSEGLAKGIGGSIADAVRDLAAALRQPSPAKPDEPPASDAPQQGRTSPDSGNSDPADSRRRGPGQ